MEYETSVTAEQLDFLFAENSVLLEEISSEIAQSVELLKAIYVSQLFVIGCVGALIVLVILYKFLRSIY